jgi:predicted acylesterase/phospholipase RssA
MTIKHLVFSGAAYNGVDMIGIITKLVDEKFIIRKDIESLYGVSAGSIVLAIWLLDIDKETLYDYIIKRPWHKIYNINIEMLFSLMTDKGILDKKLFVEIFSPLLKSKGLKPNITLGEFYIFTNKEYNLFITKVNNLEPVKINHRTHPDLSLIDAVYMSSSIPLVFKPEFFEGSYVIDGGIGKFFPLKECVNDGANKEEILGVKVTRPGVYTLERDVSLVKYIGSILNNMIRIVSNNEELDITNIIICPISITVEGELELIITTQEKREELLKNGEKCAENFLKCRMEKLGK